VHTVSPTYVEEICEPGGEFGEGLQPDLSAAREQGRLQGILNGCEYPEQLPEPLSYAEFLQLARREVLRWIGGERDVSSAHLLALEHIDRHLAAGEQAPSLQLTAVGRLTDQKLGLLATWLDDGRTALEHLLARLRDDERLLILGNGQPEMEALCTRLAASDTRLLFLCGYSEALSAQLYAAGNLFLMPSRFEPCGIAQMLAMRAGPALPGQPHRRSRGYGNRWGRRLRVRGRYGPGARRRDARAPGCGAAAPADTKAQAQGDARGRRCGAFPLGRSGPGVRRAPLYGQAVAERRVNTRPMLSCSVSGPPR
jgi:hypothetical protein